MAVGAMTFVLFVSCVYGFVVETIASDAFRSHRVRACLGSELVIVQHTRQNQRHLLHATPGKQHHTSPRWVLDFQQCDQLVMS